MDVRGEDVEIPTKEDVLTSFENTKKENELDCTGLTGNKQKLIDTI